LKAWKTDPILLKMSAIAGYMLVYSDDVYEGPSIIPTPDLVPRVLYRTIGEAEKALEVWKGKLDHFTPALYGEVYPYENTTALQQIEKKGYAIYGWTIDMSGDLEPVRYGMFILEVRVA
jgi:hypothetical protein